MPAVCEHAGAARPGPRAYPAGRGTLEAAGLVRAGDSG